MMFANADERNTRKRRYEKVLNTIEHNTGAPDHAQPAGIRQKHLNVILADYVNHAVEAIDSALWAAVAYGDVSRFEGDDGQRRYARTTDDGLQAVIGEQNVSDSPDRDLIRRVAVRLEEVGG
jgi:hypothetical protein